MGSKKIYVVLVEDRHTDVDVEVFTDRSAAIAFAKQEALDNARHPEGIEEEDIEGYIYYCRYSAESDCVSVVEKELR